MPLHPGRYTAAFPLTLRDDFVAWVKGTGGNVNIWAVETCFASEGPKAQSCVARFEVFSPVEWGALPAPENLA